ncbi:hypothetical protein ANO11243_096090 [Dothideomycetidae sp. 11243]|nr:hypothetical protein ANO11243_096090 [fungal sp. No.11243]
MAAEATLTIIREELASIPRFKNYTLSTEGVSGFGNWVYWLTPDLLTDDNKEFCVRFPKEEYFYPGWRTSNDLRILTVFSDITDSPLVPVIHHQSDRFVVMDRMPGASIEWWEEYRKDDQRRKTTLVSLADFLCMLWSTNMSDHVNETQVTYREWLETRVDRCFRRSLTLDSHLWGDPMTFLIRRRLLDAMAESSHSDEGYFVQHWDLNETNILVDSSGSVTGIVDWDCDELAPLAACVLIPRFIANIPGLLLVGRSEEPNFAEDREFFLAAVLHRYRGQPAFAALIAQLLTSSPERHFYELALYSREINMHYIRLRCDIDISESKAELKEQLDDFMCKNLDLRESERVKDLIERLS